MCFSAYPNFITLVTLITFHPWAKEHDRTEPGQEAMWSGGDGIKRMFRRFVALLEKKNQNLLY